MVAVGDKLDPVSCHTKKGYPSTSLPTPLLPYLPTYLPTYLLTCLPTHLPTLPPTYLPTHLPTLPPTYLPTYLPTYPPTYLPTQKSTSTRRSGTFAAHPPGRQRGPRLPGLGVLLGQPHGVHALGAAGCFGSQFRAGLKTRGFFWTHNLGRRLFPFNPIQTEVEHSAF